MAVTGKLRRRVLHNDLRDAVCTDLDSQHDVHQVAGDTLGIVRWHRILPHLPWSVNVLVLYRERDARWLTVRYDAERDRACTDREFFLSDALGF